MFEFNLSTSMKEGNLYFNLSGKVTSQNATNLSNMLISERKNNSNGSVIFDCEELTYISSAGLRVLLSFKKKEKEPIKIINVLPDVYEIFDTTGFTEIFDVSQKSDISSNVSDKLRDVSNDKNVHKIGYSGGITLYNIGDDIFMKVYKAGTGFELIEREKQYAQAAFLSNIPTLIAYDIVTFNGQYGMLYELPKAKTVFSHLEQTPWKIMQYAADMGKLLRQIHSAEPHLDIIPRASEVYKSYAEKMNSFFNASEIQTLINIIDVIPEAGTAVYDNFNARNVFVHQNGDLILINMTGIQYGDPIYDLGRIYMTHICKSNDIVKLMTGFEAFQAKKFWENMMFSYFDTNNLAEINKHEERMEASALLYSALYPACYKKMNGVDLPARDIDFLVAQTRREFFPQTEKIKSLLNPDY